MEDKNYKEWGGKPTTLILKESNDYFDSITKTKLYEFIYMDFGLDLKADNSDKNIENAVNRIISLEYIKPNDLVLKHNIEYGFARNLAGGSWFLVFELAIGIGYGLSKLLDSANTSSIAITFAFSICLILSIIFKYKTYPNMVKNRAYRYAKTLMEVYYAHSITSKIK